MDGVGGFNAGYQESWDHKMDNERIARKQTLYCEFFKECLQKRIKYLDVIKANPYFALEFGALYKEALELQEGKDALVPFVKK
jgi:hypothetical protein